MPYLQSIATGRNLGARVKFERNVPHAGLDKKLRRLQESCTRIQQLNHSDARLHDRSIAFGCQLDRGKPFVGVAFGGRDGHQIFCRVPYVTRGGSTVGIGFGNGVEQGKAFLLPRKVRDSRLAPAICSERSNPACVKLLQLRTNTKAARRSSSGARQAAINQAASSSCRSDEHL